MIDGLGTTNSWSWWDYSKDGWGSPSIHKSYSDQVSGYTIRQIEDALKGQRTWNGWRDNIKNKYTTNTQQMEREIIWMQLLLIGILSSLTSCTEKTDDSYYEKYVFMNNSNYEIVIDAYTKNDDDYLKNTYSISKDSSFVQEIEIMFGSKTGIVALSDSVEIFFDSIKHNWFLPNSESEYNFLDRNNYLMDKLSDNHVKYTYVFSDSDYNNADSLK